MITSLYRVLYCSRMCLPFGPDQVDEEISRILAASRRNNAGCAITGGLLFSDGCFAQVLEGPVDGVAKTFERIQCDQRHREVTVLDSQAVRSRQFPAWSMGFAGLEPSRRLPAGIAIAASMSGVTAGHGSGAPAMLDLLKAVILQEDDRLALI